MGRYTEIIISGVREIEDIEKINDYITEKGYCELKHLEEYKLLPFPYYGDYKYFNQFDFVDFLENMDWADCVPENHVKLFVRDDGEHNFSELPLKIPDQNWKNFGKED